MGGGIARDNLAGMNEVEVGGGRSRESAHVAASFTHQKDACRDVPRG